MIGIIMAIVAGCLMSVQGVFNTNVTKVSNIWSSNSWVQFTGLLISLLFWFISGRPAIGKIFEVDHKFYLIGGVLGAFITFTVIRGMSALGPSYAVMIILISQITLAYLIEALGWFGTEKIGFAWNKLLGFGLMVAGILIFKWDRLR